jgi:hypothetical protein
MVALGLLPWNYFPLASSSHLAEEIVRIDTQPNLNTQAEDGGDGQSATGASGGARMRCQQRSICTGIHCFNFQV